MIWFDKREFVSPKSEPEYRSKDNVLPAVLNDDDTENHNSLHLILSGNSQNGRLTFPERNMVDSQLDRVLEIGGT